MTNPTRKQIEAAYFATEQLVLLATAVRESPAVKDYREMILKVLPPKPQPTVADVGWDNEKHRFAEAEHPDYGEVIMLQRDLNTGRVRILLNDYGEFHMPYALPQNLTPTGRRYTLTEVQDG